MGSGTNQAFYSDTGGDTWTTSKTALRGLGESQLVEKSDGVLLLFSRNWANCSRAPDPPDSRGDCIGVSNSTNGGETFARTSFDGRVLA